MGAEVFMKARTVHKRGKPKNEHTGNATTPRVRRRGERVSEIVKTLEEGAKQQNKIFSYLANKVGNGHPLARTKIANFGAKRRMEGSEVEYNGVTGGSARKRTKKTGKI